MYRTSIPALYAPDVVGTPHHLEMLDHLRGVGDVVEVAGHDVARRVFVVVGHAALTELASSPLLTSRYGTGLVDVPEARDVHSGESPVPFHAVNMEDGPSHAVLRGALAPLAVVDDVLVKRARDAVRDAFGWRSTLGLASLSATSSTATSTGTTASFNAHHVVARIQLAVMAPRFGWNDDGVRRCAQLAHDVAFAAHHGVDPRDADRAIVSQVKDALTETHETGTLFDVVRRAINAGAIARDDGAWLIRFAFLTAFVTTELAAVHALTLLARSRPEPGAIARFVDEAVRIQSPVARFGRVAVDDVVCGAGRRRVVIPRGARVILSFAGANHDPEAFANPRDVDVNRAHDGDAPRSFAFGAGAHACVGAGVAHVVLREIVSAVVEEGARSGRALVVTERETLRSSVNRGDRRAVFSWQRA